MNARERLIFALDVHTPGEARRLVQLLAGTVGVFKIGLELFTAFGPDALELVRASGRPAFLDLKLHDIPATVERAAAQAARLGARFVTVHALGGPAMLDAALAGAGADTQVVAVTALTSMDAATVAAIGLPGSPLDVVRHLAAMAAARGVRAFVLSPREAEVVRKDLGPGPTLICPGIRPSGAAKDDQSRADTPANALRAGADYLVIGRPIRDAKDPVAAAASILAEMSPPPKGEG